VAKVAQFKKMEFCFAPKKDYIKEYKLPFSVPLLCLNSIKDFVKTWLVLKHKALN
jgi:hypothetical protein